jgi:hypothetical protein
MGRVLVCSTMAAYVMDREETWKSWLLNGKQMKESNPDGVDFFAAIEVDARGVNPFALLRTKLTMLNDAMLDNGSWWTFSLDDGRTVITTQNRLMHIVMGQNVCMERAAADDYSHMLFVAADCEPPPDVIPKLLEVNEHVVAAHSPTYCLPNKPLNNTVSIPVATWVDPDTLCFSAACVMFDREAFRLLRWRTDGDANMSDDPCLQHDAWYNHHWPIYVRTDAITQHHPATIPPIEQRGHDMNVVRTLTTMEEQFDAPDQLDSSS